MSRYVINTSGYLPFQPPAESAAAHRVYEVELLDLPLQQQIALLTLRKSESALACVSALRRQGTAVSASRSDYAALASIRLAVLKADGWHQLTPQGHWQANRLATALAKKLGLHITTTGGDAWNDFTAACTCGWRTWVSRHERGGVNRRIGEHLRTITEHP